MNRRRVLVISTAVLLALVGMFVIVAFVNSAERRALEGTQLVPVLVANAEIEANTPATELGSLVTTEEVPERLRQDDAVRNLDNLEDQVTTSAIRAGEQIVGRQFGAASEAERGGGAEIEQGMEIVSIALEPQRAVGGLLAAGDLVSVIISLDEADVENASSPEQRKTVKKTTGLVLNNVKVTAVAGGVTAEAEEAANAVMVSLEVDGLDAERIVFGMEQGSVWLTQNGEDVGNPDGQTRTPENVYELGGGGSQ